MTLKRKILTALLAVGIVVGATACESGKKDAEKASETEIRETGNQMKILTDAQPQIRLPYSQVRQSLIVAEYLAATGAATHSFFFIDGRDDPIFECDSVGFPVPATFNLTNPLQEDPNSRGIGMVNQAEGMLGVYTGETAATYVVCLTPDGEPFVKYAEGVVDGGYPPGSTYDKESGRVVIPSGVEVPKAPVPLTPDAEASDAPVETLPEATGDVSEDESES